MLTLRAQKVGGPLPLLTFPGAIHMLSAVTLEYIYIYRWLHMHT